MSSYDVIVVGGGAIGAASLYHLTKVGITNCLLIEAKPHAGRGATGSWGSLIRVMHKSLLTTKKASGTLPFFHNFNDIVGASAGYQNCGALYFLKADELPSIKEHLQILDDAKIMYDVVASHEGKRRFPHFNWFEHDVAVFEPNAGIACPYFTCEALIDNACKRGARVFYNETVVDIVTRDNRVVAIKTNTGQEFSCGKLVVAAGMWTKNLLATTSLAIDVFNKIIQINRFCKGHVDVKTPLFIDRGLEAFGHFYPDGSFVGGIACGEIDDGGAPLERLSLSDASKAKLRISKRLNWLKTSSLEGGLRAVESYSHDGQGIISYGLPFTNLIYATGFSCTGFTLAPYAGQEIVRLIENKG